jgi:1-acyl-sn-glycerol-3-phosphate acyltransferase
MSFLRSALYQILFLPWTLILCVGFLPLLAAAPRRTVQHAARFWLEGALWMQKHILGLSFEVIGGENLPSGGAILAAKHQSAWETMVFHRLVGDPAFVLKRELLNLPLIGWYMRGTGQIPIDRASRGSALKLMLDKGKRAVEQGRSLVIFPEGTRQPTGKTCRWCRSRSIPASSGRAMPSSAIPAPSPCRCWRRFRPVSPAKPSWPDCRTTSKPPPGFSNIRRSVDKSVECPPHRSLERGDKSGSAAKSNAWPPALVRKQKQNISCLPTGQLLELPAPRARISLIFVGEF